MPLAVTTAPAPPSSLARVSAKRSRVGLAGRVWAHCPSRPKPSKAKVLLRLKRWRHGVKRFIAAGAV
jgi:hypothetical protein